GYLKTMSPEDDAEELRGELAILDEEAGHCQRIAEDLVSYARTSELQLETIDLAEFVPELLGRLEFAEQPVRSELERALVRADKGRLRQVVFNLVVNARQVCVQSDSVEVRGRIRGENYEIDIVDDGPGVPEEERTKVF